MHLDRTWQGTVAGTVTNSGCVYLVMHGMGSKWVMPGPEA